MAGSRPFGGTSLAEEGRATGASGGSFDDKGERSSQKLNFRRNGKREKEEGVEGPSATSAGRVPGLTLMLPSFRPVPREWREDDSSTPLLSSSGFPCKGFFRRHVIASVSRSHGWIRVVRRALDLPGEGGGEWLGGEDGECQGRRGAQRAVESPRGLLSSHKREP